MSGSQHPGGRGGKLQRVHKQGVPGQMGQGVPRATTSREGAGGREEALWLGLAHLPHATGTRARPWREGSAGVGPHCGRLRSLSPGHSGWEEAAGSRGNTQGGH